MSRLLVLPARSPGGATPVSLIVGLAIAFVSVCCILASATPRHASDLAAAQGRSPLLLKDEPSLQAKVTFEATNLPMANALRELSKAYKVDLRAAPTVRDQRVTLHVDKQPLYHIMGRIAGVLSHSPSAPRGYHWEKLETSLSARPGFRLWRDARSLQEEQEELDYPRRKSAELVREFRRLVRMSAEERKGYKGSLPGYFLTHEDLQDYRDALSGMSDADVETLVSEGSVPLDKAAFADQIAAFDRQLQAQNQNGIAVLREQAISEGRPDPFPNGALKQTAPPPAIIFEVLDNGGEHPTKSTAFGLRFEGANLAGNGPSAHTYDVIDPYLFAGSPMLDTKGVDAPVIDLTPLLTAADITPEQRGDLGFTLQTMAKTAKVNLYQEAFYKTVGYGSRSSGLQMLKGTLTQLLNAICKVWGYQVRKVGDDYVLWSTTWAQDRAMDIPESLLANWRARYEKQGGFTLNDRLEMAARLSWAQLFVTLTMAIEESGRWNSQSEAEAYRFLGRFTPDERTAIERGGLTVAAMDIHHQQFIVGRAAGKLKDLRSEQVGRLNLTLTRDKETRLSEGKSYDRAWLRLKTEDGATLWQYTLISTTLKPPAQIKRKPD